MSSQNSIPGFLSVPEAAQFLKISAGAVYNKIYKKELPYFKPGGKKVLFKLADLQSYVEAARVPSSAEIEAEAATISARRKR